MTLSALIETRIKEIPEFRDVGGAAGLDEALKGRFSGPGCYIFLEGHSGGENEAAYPSVLQNMGLTVALLIVSRNVSGVRGALSADDNETLLNLIRSKLLGWQPSGDIYTPLVYSSGSIISMQGGFLVWKENYLTNYYIRGL
jgi:hypothetical protein